MSVELEKNLQQKAQIAYDEVIEAAGDYDTVAERFEADEASIALKANQSALLNETLARQTGEQMMQGQIAGEAALRQAGDTALQSDIITLQINVGNKLNKNIDSLSELQIKYVIPEVPAKPAGFQTTSAFATDHAAIFTSDGTLIAHGITEVGANDAQYASQYTGAIECEQGQVKVYASGSNKYILYNISGTRKYYVNFNVGLGSHEFRGENAVADYELDNVTWKTLAAVPAVPEKSDYKALFRWSGTSFQVAYLNTADTYKTL